MQLPFFYNETNVSVGGMLPLTEKTSRHVVNVLRMKQGDRIHLTDGKGTLLTAEIINDHKKNCIVVIKEAAIKNRAEQEITIAISLLKNASRFEWFLEKATEIGVTTIIPLLCERTERQHFRKERMAGLLLSAMLQSRQCWLPDLLEPVAYSALLNNSRETGYQQKYIAHCDDANSKENLSTTVSANSSIILIGPEGDFTNTEIEQAVQHQFIPVSLGNTRLRSETAGVVAATVLRMKL